MQHDFRTAVREAFERQTVMATIGATLAAVEPGLVEIRLDSGYAHLTQQHGYLHAGVTTALVDSACGFAAWTMAPQPANVLTIEYKVNFLAPGAGASFLARGRVKKAGRAITVCEGEMIAFDEKGGSKTVAVMLATMTILPA